MGISREDALKIWLPIIRMGVENMPECKESLDMAIASLKADEAYNLMYEGVEVYTKEEVIAMLTEIQLEIECCEKSDCDYVSSDCLSQWQIDTLIQQKINALKGETDARTNEGRL